MSSIAAQVPQRGSRVVRQVFSLLSNNARARAFELASRGCVRIENSDDGFIEAYIDSTSGQTYFLDLSWDESVLEMSCSCPMDERGQVCKHLGALLLHLERTGELSPLERLAPFRDIALGRDEPLDINSGIDISRRPTPVKPKPNWRNVLGQLSAAVSASSRAAITVDCQLLYTVKRPPRLTSESLQVELASRQRKQNGAWGKPQQVRMPTDVITALPDPCDRAIFSGLAGASEGYYAWSPVRTLPAIVNVPLYLNDSVVQLMCESGRCWLTPAHNSPGEPKQLTWDDAAAWELRLKLLCGARSEVWELRRLGLSDGAIANKLRVTRESVQRVLKEAADYRLSGYLRRGEECMELNAVDLLVPGLVIANGRVARLRDDVRVAWVDRLLNSDEICVPHTDSEALLRELVALPGCPPVDLPEELRCEEVEIAPIPRLRFRKDAWSEKRLDAELMFRYGAANVAPQEPGRGILDFASRKIIVRNAGEEQAAKAWIRQLGFRQEHLNVYSLSAAKLPKVVHQLSSAGWLVEAEGKLYRQPGKLSLSVSSGIDWFDLEGSVAYDDQLAPLPELIAALRRGESWVTLADGSLGILPEQWLSKHQFLITLGDANGRQLRFQRTQAGFLDLLLASQSDSSCDAAFRRAREQLVRFAGIKPAGAPAGFMGELRPYQRDGLGWFSFLREFGFGGCLADDMGLGKTVQVLALLEARRADKSSSDTRRPSLVVAPRSLIFNWKQEAARFTPQLRVLDHSSTERNKSAALFCDYDLVLTTYGMVRRDAGYLKDASFDYVILDEAQAIKNAATDSAKAVRLLTGCHRLALSGTPVENHLGELWSLFEFLNPGILGSGSSFRGLLRAGRPADDESVRILARALRPFFLRRTKEQVAKELPARTEQTLFCELDERQRKDYDQLRAHYRQGLLARVAANGVARSSIQVLEALLRLRQAACHPGLIDRARSQESSAKLEMLLGQLADVVAEGHKALVFSQFTTLLAIVKNRLEAEGVRFAYLDGDTRDRAAAVEQFRTLDCPVFLISLKAGGLGLNLTDADYVFLLDPWWNPAVEAQAIDRAHRIGQTRNVFAYRLIARATVEERVLQLQQGKRELADAIIGQNSSLLSSLSAADLDLLLS